MEKSDLSQLIEKKELQKIKAKKNGLRSVWYGVGMFGLIGWSIVVPTLLGALLGVYLDAKYPTHLSWTLSLLTAGLIMGCFNAWRWVEKENKSIEKEQEDFKK